MSNSKRRFNMISEVNADKETWRIRGRLIRVWRVPQLNNTNETRCLDMIIMDEKQSKIHATIKSSLISDFSQRLREGLLVIISNFGVDLNNDKQRVCSHNFKISFYRTTSIRECENIPIPLYDFDFVNFEDILSNKVNPNIFIDIIDLLKGVSPIVNVGDQVNKKKILKIDLQDASNMTLPVTLWGDFAETLKEYIADHVGPVVVILQFSMIRKFREVEDLKKCFASDDTSHTLCEISAGNSVIIEEEFSRLSKRKFVDELQEINEPCYCAVLATTVKIETESGWFYLSCKACIRKVTSVGNGLWHCEVCRQDVQFVVPRFRVTLRVMDDTGIASFVMFDKEVSKLLNTSASALREILMKDDDADAFPKELDDLLKKQFLFRIRITDFNLKNNWRKYRIYRLTDDINLINTHTHTSALNVGKVQGHNITTSESVDKNVNEFHKECISITCDNDDCHESEDSRLTSIKRTIDFLQPDETSVDIIDAQCLTNKKKVVVKIEKDS
ncbi:hypothetical protein RND81_07G045900 [Saponaria officinalis]|uniref:Uncharacterized protein n=1 Tax=Saponaria officinalis TaxID=3572 RepID=A0AAW1JRN8_SAPOF